MLLLAATVVSYRFVFDLGFTDTDAWADYRAAGQSWAHQLTMPLTDGVGGANANFFRPTANLHFKLLRTLFGDWALGWQAWDLGLHLACVVLLGLVVRAAGGGPRTALLAGGLAALHPLGVEVVPAVARNIDLLLSLLVLGSALALLRGRWVVAALLGLLALGCKETAVALMPLALLFAWRRGGRDGALRLGVPWLIGGVAFLALRSFVLSGLGGYDPQPIDPVGLERVLRTAVLEHAAPGWAAPLAGWSWPAQLALGVLASIFVLYGIHRVRRMGTGLTGAALFLAPLLLYGLVGLYNRRLLYLTTLGWSVLLATWIVRDRHMRLPALLGVAFLLPHTPLWHQDEDWARNDAVTRSMEANREELAALPAGTVVWVLDRCLRVHTDPVRQKWWGDTSQNNCVGFYSLQAWVDEFHDLQLMRLSLVQPTSPMLAAEVEVDDEGFTVTRDAGKRSVYKAAREAGWEIDEGGDSWHFSLPEHDGEFVIVLGGAKAQLLPIP
ncbi:MAG TPA: hypothetical protein QGF58_15830 [Myxococcota bacterium]|nr:hypothetical protein [Myxococcota bacterium]